MRLAKPARKTNAGRALLQAADQHAGCQGVARLDLTSAKTNLVAQSVYASLGWSGNPEYPLLVNFGEDSLVPEDPWLLLTTGSLLVAQFESSKKPITTYGIVPVPVSSSQSYSA